MILSAPPRTASQSAAPEDVELAARIKLLEWDSKFWGFPIARLAGNCLIEEQIGSVDTWCRTNGVRCVYFLAPADDPTTTSACESNGFHLVDLRLTLSRPAPAAAGDGVVSAESAGLSIRPCRADDIGSLREIARDVHSDTRFYFDRKFAREQANLLYEIWIQRSCEKSFADEVFVATVADQPVGYITCQVASSQRRVGSIGLLGVGSQARGRGAGQRLICTALEWFAQRGVEEIEVVTQGRNYGAQRLYQHHGFRTKRLELWYHKWYACS